MEHIGHHVNWVVSEIGMNEGSFKKLMKSIEKEKDCSIIKVEYERREFQNIQIEKKNSNIVLYGSLEFVKHIGNDCFPGAYGYGANVDAHIYMSYFPLEWFLNEDAVWTAYGTFEKDAEKYFDLFGKKELFIKPDSGKKSFTGFVLNENSSKKELRTLNQLENPNKENFILVSTAKKITEEVRCVIVDKKFITGSHYGWNGTEEKILESDEFIEFAEKVAGFTWQPDIAYTLDLCKLEDETIKIVELNSFSCAGLYACDTDAIVREINKISREEWNCFD